ncbi:unnamed protein product [Calypogeia fissa]
MSDAACDLNNTTNSLVAVTSSSSASLVIEEHWRKGIILVQIWREVLRVILFAGKPGEGLDEKSKREMWLLLVAAGSGYLARCWHKTLKPKPQLTDHPNGDGHDSQDTQHPHHTEEDQHRMVDDTNTNNLLISAFSSEASKPLLQAETGNTTTPLDTSRVRKTPELAPKPLKRNFSPKALGKKLFSSDSSRNGKSFKKDSALSSSAGGGGLHRSTASADGGERETSRWIGSVGVERSLSHDASASVGHSGSRRSPWSSFRSYSTSKVPAREGSPGAVDDDDDSSTESSPGCLKRAGDSFRKSRRRTDPGSLSSRSLQGLLGGDVGDGGPPSAGSSRREMDPPDSVFSSSALSRRSLSSEASGELKESPEVVTSRRKAAENEAKSSSSDMVTCNNSSSSSSTILPKDAPLNSVAAVVARIEKGNFASAKEETVNAILSLRAANEAQARSQAIGQGGHGVAVSDIVKVRNLKVEVPELDSVEESEIFPGGKGKRRAGDGGSSKVSGGIGGEAGMGAGHSAPLSTGKRTKDSKDSIKSDSSGVTLTSITGKWMKDVSFVPRDVGVFDDPSTSAALGAVDLSQVFFGFDSTYLVSPTEEKSPFRFYRRSRMLSRTGRGNMRKMRESPRPVSALESCLRAQFPERDNEGSRVARSLNFSSTSVNGRGGHQPDPNVEIPFLKDGSNADSPSSSSDGRGGGQSPQQTGGALGLPLLGTPPSRSGSGIVDRGDLQLVESASKYPRKVVYEDRGRVISSQSKLSDVLLRTTTLPVAMKKRKVSQACSPSANSIHLQTKGYELEALVIPPMEGLLFCFGVGIGVMSLIDGPDDKVERLSKELQKSEEKVESLNNMLLQARESSTAQATASLSKEIVVAKLDSSDQAHASLSKEIIVAEQFSGQEIVSLEVSSNNLSLQSESPLDPLSITPTIEEMERKFDLYRREAPETPQQTEHMAELEAELEAELDALTSSITDAASGPPDFEELDPEGVAGVADRDLGVEGLPAVVDWDDDNDDFITEEPAHTGGGVPPRELSRLLRKVQNSRHEQRIAELEADLQETVEKLHAMEKELKLLKEKTKNFAPPSAGTGAEKSDSVGAPEGPVQKEDSSWSAKIERLNQSVLEDQESRREESNQSGAGHDSRKESAQKSSGEQSAPSTSLREDHESKTLVSVASEPSSSKKGLVINDPISPLPARAVSEPVSRHHAGEAGLEFGVSAARESTSGGQVSVSSWPGYPSQHVVVASRGELGGLPRSASSMILTEESMNCETQSENDAVCDEFLSSVFCSPNGSQLGLSTMSTMSSVMSSPLIDQMPLSTTPEENSSQTAKELSLDTMASAVAEDLDQVVGQLLKRDSSSVKNAINAFLRWEAAERDDAPSKDESTEEETTAGGFSRRTAGKNPTPQKTPILASVATTSVTPQKASVISSRLEHLARSTFTSEKLPYVEKPIVGLGARRLGLTSEEKSPVGKGVEVFQQQKTIEVFQPPAQPKLPDDRSPKSLALWEYPAGKKEHSSPTLRRGEAGKAGETSMSDTLRDLFRGESPVFGGGERDFQALLDSRRELRYASSKVQLSLTGPDTAPVFKPREDPTRAGTNSPISSRPPTRNAFQSPKLKHSRLALENRLYQNPTSDWLAEVGSPPDLE